MVKHDKPIKVGAKWQLANGRIQFTIVTTFTSAVAWV